MLASERHGGDGLRKVEVRLWPCVDGKSAGTRGERGRGVGSGNEMGRGEEDVVRALEEVGGGR